jgi:hypothetical protein
LRMQLYIRVFLVLIFVLAIERPANAENHKAAVRLNLRGIHWANDEIIEGGELKITNALIVIPKPSSAGNGLVKGEIIWAGFTCLVLNHPKTDTASMAIGLIYFGIPLTKESQQEPLKKDSFEVETAKSAKCSHKKCPIIIKGKLIFSRYDPTSRTWPKYRYRTLLINQKNFITTYEK